MQLDFTNKNVLITGGSRGIGKACAQLFAALNANVIITYKSDKAAAEEVIASLNPKQNHRHFQLDITDAKAVQIFYQDFETQYQQLDVLVNNAGVFKEHKIENVNYEQWQQAWQQTLDTNLTGVANLCYFAARQMMVQKAGKIINISSRGAFRGEPDQPAYGASKAGLNALSQSLAVALAPHNITVGVIAPGFIETDMAAEAMLGEAGEQIRKQSPLNRIGKPEEVARAVAMFASSGLEFMTGGIIDLNGASYLRS
jgi:3-oxoacyl-[acyl-carrier protein] reductase